MIVAAALEGDGCKMRRFPSFGDGLPMTTVTLLVCGPVLFGLALILFEPFRDPSWQRDFVVNPGKHALIYFWLLIFFHGVLTPNVVAPDGANEQQLATTGLKWISDMFWAMAVGIMVCLMVVVDEKAVATGRENVAAYVAFVITIISIVLRWRDRRERMGIRPDRNSIE